jgi:hypothetical protein
MLLLLLLLLFSLTLILFYSLIVIGYDIKLPYDVGKMSPLLVCEPDTVLLPGLVPSERPDAGAVA